MSLVVGSDKGKWLVEDCPLGGMEWEELQRRKDLLNRFGGWL